MLWAGATSAQDWATRALCDVQEPKLDLSQFPGLDVERIHSEAAARSNGVGKYWQIKSPSGAISHLWGTYHSSHRLMLDLPEPVLRAIQTARVVALELDPAAHTRAELIHRATQQDYYLGLDLRGNPKTNRFEDILGDEILGWIDSRLESNGWGERAANYLKPEILAEILLASPCDDFAYGTYVIQDSYIQMLGYIAGAEIVGLEPVDALREKLRSAKNRALTFDMIRLYGWYLDPDQTHAEHANSFATYLTGQNALAMALERAQLRAYFGETRGPALQDRVDEYLLGERNITFADTAEPALRRGGVFMAIGSWHLPGEAGMVELLRRRGYTVTRIPLPGEAQE